MGEKAPIFYGLGKKLEPVSLEEFADKTVVISAFPSIDTPVSVSYTHLLKEGSKAYEAYGQKMVEERHRHRYEFNNEYKEAFEKGGMITTGINPDTGLTEIIEIPSHKWFIGTQFHPEYKSTVVKPHPLFVAFIDVYKRQGGGFALILKQQ